MTVALTERQTAILAAEMQPKFLASLSATGEPNVVPVLSLCPYGPGTAGFAEFMLWKTKANLQATGRAAILAMDAKLEYFTAHGRLTSIVNSGPLFDAMANQGMFLYNPYNGIRGAGAIELEAVDAEGRLPALTVLAAHLRASRLARSAAATARLARSAGGAEEARSPAGGGPASGNAGGSAAGATMPPQVAEKFARLKALKAVAWPVKVAPAGTGRAATAAEPGKATGAAAPDVRVLPAAGVAPVGRSRLVVADRAVAEAVPDGSRVAVAVITLDPVAYQVKGTARPWRGALLVEVTEAYTAGPPVPGRLCSSAAG